MPGRDVHEHAHDACIRTFDLTARPRCHLDDAGIVVVEQTRQHGPGLPGREGPRRDLRGARTHDDVAVRTGSRHIIEGQGAESGERTDRSGPHHGKLVVESGARGVLITLVTGERHDAAAGGTGIGHAAIVADRHHNHLKSCSGGSEELGVVERTRK